MTGTVLLVDDEPDVLFATRVALESRGYAVIEAAGGQEALELAATTKVDAILLDLRMPGLDGWGVLEQLRTAGEGSRLPVIVLSAHADPVKVERSTHLGARGYVRKPFRLSELTHMLETVLAHGLDRADQDVRRQ